jgi:hypothetical protein
VSEGSYARLSAWAAVAGVFTAVVSIVVTWTLASKEQRADAVKYMTGSSRSDDTSKAPARPPSVVLAPSYPQAAGTIAGVWNGTVFYLDGRAPKPFTFTFDTTGCRGRGDEPNTFGDQTSTRLFSNLECATNTLSPGQPVTIKKTYDGTAGATHAVNYGGTVSPDARKISGQWSTGLSRGNFVLER